MSNQWKHGLFDCFDDLGFCLLACFCPCIAHTKNQEARDGLGTFGSNCCMCYFCGPCYRICTLAEDRAKTRQKFQIGKEGCDDCPATCFCTPCALTQEHLQIISAGGGAPGQQNMQ